MNNDLISREALKKAVEELRRPKAYSEADVRWNVVVDCVLHCIDNASPINPCENCDLYFKAITKEEIKKALSIVKEVPEYKDKFRWKGGAEND